MGMTVIYKRCKYLILEEGRESVSFTEREGGPSLVVNIFSGANAYKILSMGISQMIFHVLNTKGLSSI